MMRWLLSFFACQHAWSWPIRNQEVCNRCGATRKARVDFSATHSTASIPRYEPRATAEEHAKVAVIRKRKRAGAE